MPHFVVSSQHVLMRLMLLEAVCTRKLCSDVFNKIWTKYESQVPKTNMLWRTIWFWKSERYISICVFFFANECVCDLLAISLGTICIFVSSTIQKFIFCMTLLSIFYLTKRWHCRSHECGNVERSQFSADSVIWSVILEVRFLDFVSGYAHLKIFVRCAHTSNGGAHHTRIPNVAHKFQT